MELAVSFVCRDIDDESGQVVVSGHSIPAHSQYQLECHSLRSIQTVPQSHHCGISLLPFLQQEIRSYCRNDGGIA